MPLAAPSRCTEPGCVEFAINRGRCGEHQRVGWEGRPSMQDRYGMSGSAWDALRRRILLRDAHTCQQCGAEAVEVDHIIPVGEGGANKDPSNLQSLCLACHARKTKREAARAARRARAARARAAAVAAEPPPF